MEKISKILPPSARTTGVDLKSSPTARAGMPSFGREQIASSVANRNQGDVFTRAMDRHKDLMSARVGPKDPQVEIVEKMADNFFMSKSRPVEGPEFSADDILAKDFDADMNPDTVNVNTEKTKWAASMDEAVPESEIEDMDAPDIGGNLDVVA